MPGLIPNPDPNPPTDNSTLVQTRTSPAIFNYLFRSVLSSHGARQALLNTFLHAFATVCHAEGIPPFYDIDNEQRAAAILKRINFRSNESGRTDRTAPEHNSQSKVKGHEPGRANSIRDSAPKSKRQRADTRSKAS